MRPVFTWHFVGVSVAPFASALRFYQEGLGFAVHSRKADWAWLDGTGLQFELFGGAPSLPAGAAWGRGQAARVRIEVADLDETRRRLARFAVAVEPSDDDGVLAFCDPEGVTWSLAVDASRGPRPHLAAADLKVADLPAQTAFYREVMGLRASDAVTGGVRLVQDAHPATLTLRAGGRPAAPERLQPAAPRSGHPVVLTFETPDIDAAATWLDGQGVRMLQRRTVKPWGGIDLYALDADGHPLQVVQYVTPPA